MIHLFRGGVEECLEAFYTLLTSQLSCDFFPSENRGGVL
jgi:hypothetical protein